MLKSPSGFVVSAFVANILFSFLISALRSIFPAHLILFDLTSLLFLKITNHEASHYAVVFGLFVLPPQHPVLKDPQSLLFPVCESSNRFM